ncbi:hypothetical protein BDV95DRAFT_603347 [Massariosphaeria phaeospora]|uniref:Uncharacterized protein n=1 Tax=Massariosphaeria phaeospora TaxID=100035 RepID=A0A7C8MVE4_9PLEO|nr:hypothetical protein BDV95DRAFT_603347 [Massariosphaeria phaeospora]
MSRPTATTDSSLPLSFSPATTPFRRCHSWPQQPPRKTCSQAHNAAMRELMRPWGSLPPTPPGSRAVSFSSWSRFSASTTSSKSSEEMTAATIWGIKGTTPDYNPPPTEWCYLGAEQPLVPGKPQDRPTRQQRQQQQQHRRQQSSGSWATASSVSVSGTAPIVFRKEEVRGAKTSSLLTESLKSGGPCEAQSAAGVLGKQLGVGAGAGGMARLSASMLPSAFDSDSEDEEDD